MSNISIYVRKRGYELCVTPDEEYFLRKGEEIIMRSHDPDVVSRIFRDKTHNRNDETKYMQTKVLSTEEKIIKFVRESGSEEEYKTVSNWILKFLEQEKGVQSA